MGLLVFLVHFAPWYRNQMKLELSDDCKPIVEGQSELEVPVSWATPGDAEARYLNRGFGNSYDFGQLV